MVIDQYLFYVLLFEFNTCQQLVKNALHHKSGLLYKRCSFFLSENETPCLTKPNPPSLIDRTARCTRGPNNTTQYNLGVPETFQLREISGEGTRLFREHRLSSVNLQLK